MSSLAIQGGSPVRTKPFPAWPQVDASDEKAVLEVVRGGKWWMYAYGDRELSGASGGESSRVEAFEKAFARFQHVKHALATASGSGALEMCCRAIGLQSGDEVITTPYTFIASASCVLNAQAIPVFVDIDPQTYNIDPALIERAITPRTKAILPVHFGGNIADMDAIAAIASKHNLRVIEDAAQAQGASLQGGRYAGALGDVAIFSLQQSKLLTCGEGGIFTTQDDRYAELAWSLRHYGRTKTGLWYEHHNLGWHYRMTEMQGALLLTQLAKLDAQNATRRRNADALFKALAGVPGITPCRQNPNAENKVYYLVFLRYDEKAWDGLPRETLLKALAAEGIPCLGGYSWPLYENPVFTNLDFNGPASPYRMGRTDTIDYRRYRGRCPVAERACRQEAIWLNQNVLLGSESDALDIARALEKLYANRGQLLAME